MDGPDYVKAAASLFSAFAFDRLMPLLTLIGMAAMFVWVLFKAQKSSHFDASDFLRADSGKLSSGRLFAFICCMTHTWAIFVRVLNDKIQMEEFVLYASVWSGSLLVMQALDVYRGVKTPPVNMPPPQAEEKPQ